MFVIKRKGAVNAADAEQRRIEEQQRLVAARVASQPADPEPASSKRTEKVYLASEIIVEAPAPTTSISPEKVYLESEIINKELVLEPVEETAEEVEPAEAGKLKPAEAIDGALAADSLAGSTLEDNAEKPASISKFAKLPKLVDCMLAMSLSKSVRMSVAAMLLKQYDKYKDSPEERAAIVECLKKLVASLSKA